MSRTLFFMCGTVAASTWRSGSATVIAKPSRKLTPRMSGRFFVLVSAVPIFEPMGIIATSAPSENRPMPTTIITAPMRKHSSRSACIGITNRHSTSTIATIGSTEIAASRVFSAVAVCAISKCCSNCSLCFFFLISLHSFIFTGALAPYIYIYCVDTVSRLRWKPCVPRLPLLAAGAVRLEILPIHFLR